MDARRNEGLDVTDAIERYASLVRLSGPKPRGRGLVHDFVREAEVRGHLADLGLVEISDGEEVRTGVPKLCRVSGQDLTLIPGPHHHAVLRVGAVVQYGHPCPRTQIASGDGVCLGGLEPLLHGRCDWADV